MGGIDGSSKKAEVEGDGGIWEMVLADASGNECRTKTQ